MQFDTTYVDMGRRSYIQSLSRLSSADSFYDDLIAWFAPRWDDPKLC